MAGVAIGIMDPAFFVGKKEILKWLNDFFEIGYTKIEQGCTGAIHCQILDAIYPGKVPLHKVNFDAKHDYEYVANWKVLQNVFTAMEIPKHVDVEKLIKGKYQDNLEFLQWIKNFFETKYSGNEYKAKEIREKAMQAFKRGKGAARAGAPAAAAPKTESKAPAAAKESKIAVAKPAPKKAAAAPAAAKKAAAPAKATAAAKKPSPAKAPAKAAGGGGADSAKVAELTAQIATLTGTIEGLEKERNFYFGKLREIEILCQTDEAAEATTKQAVLKILYHTDPEDEFQSPTETAQDAPVAEGGAEGEEAAAAGGEVVSDAELLQPAEGAGEAAAEAEPESGDVTF